MKRFLAALAALSLAASAQAAVAVDSRESSNVGHNSATSPLTWSFTNTAGTFMVCGIASSQTAPDGATAVTAVTYNGASLTAVPSGTFTFGTGVSATVVLSLYYMQTPATGSNTVSVTWTKTGTPTNVDAIAGCTTFTGVDGTTPLGTPFTNKEDALGNTSTATVNVTSTTSGNMVVDLVATGSGVSSATAPSSLSWLKNASTHTGGDNAAQATQAAGGTITMAYTITTDIWGIIAVELKATAGGGATCRPTLTVLGVGRCG